MEKVPPEHKASVFASVLSPFKELIKIGIVKDKLKTKIQEICIELEK